MDSNASPAPNIATNFAANTASENAVIVAGHTAPNNAVNAGETTPTNEGNSTIIVITDKSNFRWNFLEDDALIDVLVDMAKPKERSLRYKGVRHFDKLCIIFGVDQAHGNLSYEPNDDLPIHNLHLDSGTAGDTSDAPEFMHVDPATPTYPDVNATPTAGGGGTFGDGGQPSGAKSKALAGQKRHRSLPGYDKFDDSILLMAEAAKEMASSFDKPIMPRLLPALKGIPELSHGDIKRAMIIFGRDRKLAEILVFMDESMRYSFVMDMIG